MRSWVFISIAFIALMATRSYAEPIVVRSGAHDGFSRLVLDVSPKTDWVLENSEDSARITIRDHKDGFDTGRVFDRIDQTHIARLNGDAEYLEVNFSCRCTLAAFKQGERMIVLDISNSSGDSDALVSEYDAAGALPPISPENRFGTPASSFNLLQSNPLPEDRNLSPTFHTSIWREQEIHSSPANFIADDVRASGLANAQRRISEQVGAAATRGVLRPKVRSVNLPLLQNRPQIDTQIFDSSARKPTRREGNDTAIGGNLKITSSSDIPNELGLSSGSTTLGVHCIGNEITAFADWASDQPFSAQIAGRRSALFSEFDKLNQTEALRLARTYLYFGFGMEVREVLELHPQLTQNSPALLEMAEIMEYGYTKQPEYLHHFLECDSDVALWAVLSKRSIDPNQSINKNAVLRAVTALPMHLRTFIAPELSRRLLNYGDPDAAAAALRSLERASEQLPPSANLAKADIEMEQGNVTEAQDRLAHVVGSNVEQSAEALIKFVNSHLNADTPIEESVATLVEAYALQMRDEPIGAELRRTYVLALGKSGQFDAAFDALTRIQERGGNETDGAVASAILDLLTRDGDDVLFLEHVFQQMSGSLAAIDPKTNLIIAKRLVELGFAPEAERILAIQNGDPNSETARIVRAKVALSLSRPFEAQAVIFGLTTAEADALRAEAKAKSGDFNGAHSLFARLGDEDGSEQAAWLSNDWVSLIEQDTPVLGDVVRVAQAQVSEEFGLDGMLSRTSAAIAESADARSVIYDLLQISDTETVSQRKTGKTE